MPSDMRWSRPTALPLGVPSRRLTTTGVRATPDCFWMLPKPYLSSSLLLALFLSLPCTFLASAVDLGGKSTSRGGQNGQDPGASGGGQDCSEKVLLRADLADAERLYNANLARYTTHRHRQTAGALASRSPVEFVADELVPTYPCAHEDRFGQWGEGGKWLCMRHRQVHSAYSPSYLRPAAGSGSGGAGGQAGGGGAEEHARPFVVSIGSHGESSFEQDLFQQLRAVTHTFDPFLSSEVEASVRGRPHLTFHPIGLVGSEEIESTRGSNPGKRFVTLQGLLELLNTSYVDVFKIDCEGCEFAVMRDLAKGWRPSAPPFGQIAMEVHALRTNSSDLVDPLLQTLYRFGYRLFHAEMNGFARNGYEVALIHETLVRPEAT